MTWSAFYLICFGVGFTLSAVSFLSGALNLHVPLKWHLPSGVLHHGGAAPVAHCPPGAASPAGKGAHGSAKVSVFNVPTLLVFLAWFGGTGYLLTQYSRFWYLLSLGLATAGGLVGASFVAVFMVKVLLPHETVLDPSDYELIGQLAKVHIPIRAGGTGEIVFSLGGTRHVAGARSDDGTALPKGAEVVIARYEKGIAYVRRWEEWTK